MGGRLLRRYCAAVAIAGSVCCIVVAAPVGIEDSTPVTKLVNPAGGESDCFGFAVALAGGDLLVGAPFDDTVAEDAGAVYVYARDGDTWVQCDALAPSDAAAGQAFGWSIAVDPDNPDTVVIGSPRDDQAAPDAGAVYVFVRDDQGAWIEQTKLVGGDTPADSSFGTAVAIDGPRLIVGAPFEDNFIGTMVGDVYIFERDGGEWYQVDKVFPSMAPDAALFGAAVAVDGDAIIAGAPYLGMGFTPGAAFTFRRAGPGWAEEQRLISPISVGRDRFGGGVALAGEIAVVGAPRDGVPPTGLVATFAQDSAGGSSDPWTVVDYFLADDFTLVDRFGGRLVLDGPRLAVSAPSHAENGAVYLYDFESGVASFTQKIMAADGDPYDYFGGSLALAGNTLAIGAYQDDENAPDTGSVYVYDLSPTDPRGDLDGDGDVDLADLAQLLAHYGLTSGATHADGDLDDDGDVDLADLAGLLADYTG